MLNTSHMASDGKPDTATLMTIGSFGKATRLSLKALRLYDTLGLLPPAWVDPDSGYRYYQEEQVNRARLIARLRMLDMPLSGIARVLEHGGAEGARILKAWWRDVEEGTASRRRLVTSVTRYLKGEIIMKHKVETRQVPEQKLLTLERRVFADKLPATIGELGEALYGHISANSVQIAGPMMVIYHDEVNMDSDGPIEVCVPVAGAVEPFGETRVRMEPAHKVAYARISKREVQFPDILEAYSSVEAWIRENGEQVAGSPREIYIADWAQAQDDDLVCDIAFPLAG